MLICFSPTINRWPRMAARLRVFGSNHIIIVALLCLLKCTRLRTANTHAHTRPFYEEPNYGRCSQFGAAGIEKLLKTGIELGPAVADVYDLFVAPHSELVAICRFVTVKIGPAGQI